MAFGDWAPPFLILLAVLALATLALSRLLSRRRGEPKREMGPVAVPPEEAELAEGQVTACMRCGSPHVRQPRLSEGLIPGFGEGLVWICARCKWRGQPLVFEDVTAYRQFVKGLNADAEAGGAPRAPE